MSRDAKNSILLWLGVLVYVGLFWAFLHFDLADHIPDGWMGPLLGVAVGLNGFNLIRDFLRRRKANVG